MRLKSRRFQGVLAGLVAALAMPAAAQAACPAAQPVSNPFAQFGDHADYVLAPGGGFESGMQGWTLSGGASVVSGNESFSVRGASDQRALRLPEGATALSPAFCVDDTNPTMRMFLRQAAGTSSLRVEVLYDAGKVKKPGMIRNYSDTYAQWSPSPVLKLADQLPTSLTSTYVQLKITADSGGTWEVDDVYIDPRAL